MFSKRRPEQLCSHLKNRIVTDVAPSCKNGRRKRGMHLVGMDGCNAVFFPCIMESFRQSALLYFPCIIFYFLCIQGVRYNFGGSPLVLCRGGKAAECGEKRAKDEIETGHAIAKRVNGQVATTVCIKAALHNILIDGDDPLKNGISCISASTPRNNSLLPS